jgi:hypothetical protein
LIYIGLCISSLVKGPFFIFSVKNITIERKQTATATPFETIPANKAVL